MTNTAATVDNSAQIAETALRQLARGQNPQILARLLGVKQFVRNQKANGDVTVSFQFKGNRKVNVCWLTYNVGPDTYTLELVKYSATKVTFTPVYKAEGLYFDQLAETFERQTGLYVTL